jgi:hypothetical protein
MNFSEGSKPGGRFEARRGRAKSWDEHFEVPGDALPDVCGGSVFPDTLPLVGAGDGGARVAPPSNKAKIRKSDRTI